MIVKYMLEEWALAPTRAHATDAGWDLRAPFDFCVRPETAKVIDTGVHFYFTDAVGMIKSKSGLNARGLQCEGV